VSLLQLEGVSKKFGQVVVGEQITFQLEEAGAIGMLGQMERARLRSLE